MLLSSREGFEGNKDHPQEPCVDFAGSEDVLLHLRIYLFKSTLLANRSMGNERGPDSASDGLQILRLPLTYFLFRSPTPNTHRGIH